MKLIVENLTPSPLHCGRLGLPPSGGRSGEVSTGAVCSSNTNLFLDSKADSLLDVLSHIVLKLSSGFCCWQLGIWTQKPLKSKKHCLKVA